MKKITIIVISLVLLVLNFKSIPVEARYHRQPTPTPRPTPSVIPTPTGVQPTPTPILGQSGLCFNYGHQTNTYDLNGQSNLDLQKLSNSGVNCIRISYNGWNNPQSEALAVFAKSKGFRVIIGGDWGTLTSNQFSSYTSQVLQEAQWAQNNNVDQLSLGNEQEYRLNGITKDQWVTFLHSLSTQVRAIYSGKISYETSGDFADYWVTQSLGNIDLLGFNLYCGYGCNANYLQENINSHGLSHVYVSETNADMGTGLYESDATHAKEVSGDAIKLLNFNVPVYYFAFSACNNNNGVASHWGIYQCNVLVQPLTASVLGLK